MTEEQTQIPFRFVPLILPMICAIGWGGMVWFGLDLEKGVEAQSGCAALSQVIFSVIYPFAALTASLFPSAFLSQTKYAFIGNIWCGLFLLLLLYYLFLWAEIAAI